MFQSPAAHGAAVALLAGAVFLVAFGARFRGLRSSEAMQQAQLARNVATGRGYVTQVISPLGLYFDRSVRNRSDVSTPPLGPLLMAIFFRAFGADDGVAALASGIAYVASVVATWALGRRLGGARVGLLAAGLYGLSGAATSASLAATPAALGASVVAAAFAAALASVPEAESADGALLVAAAADG
ncbi:MAG: glycosyltransferase family 39 protein, partial [Armatimonadota bacterium]